MTYPGPSGEDRQHVIYCNHQTETATREQQKLARNLSQLGALLRDQGESAQAVSCLEEARIRYGKLANADRTEFATCLEHLASLYREAGREQDAVKVEAQLESMQTAPS